MPSDAMLKTMNAVHRGLLKVSGGRIGGRLSGMPVLELTTIGRKTAQPRTVMLTSPVQDGSAIRIDRPTFFSLSSGKPPSINSAPDAESALEQTIREHNRGALAAYMAHLEGVVDHEKRERPA